MKISNKNIAGRIAGTILAGTAVLAGTVSCTWNYLEINTNPYEVDQEHMLYDGYAVGAAMTSLFGTVISPHINTAQFTDVLLGGPMGHYYASTGSWDNNTIAEFNAPDDWTNPFLASDRIIPVLYSNLRLMNELTDDPLVEAISTIVKVQAMNRVTDTYGPIPYSMIGVGGAISVSYDSQKQIYEKMFEELNASINILTENKQSRLPASVDKIYGGDPVKWCKYANSLKLRLAMRIVYADRALAQRYAEEAVNHEIGVITSNADNTKVPAAIFGEGNSMYVSIKYNEDPKFPTGGDTHVAADIISYMNGYNDPRRPAYFIPSYFDGVQYVGMRIGIERPPFSESKKFSGVNIKRDSDMYWMNAAEVAFLKLEGAAVFKFNTLAGQTEEQLYKEGIRLSFEQWKITEGYDAYVEDNKSVPEAYTDPLGKDSYAGQLTNVTVKWDPAASEKVKQERIIIQKWIANFNLGNEAWADYRRTGFPKFMPATDAGNKSGGIVDNVKGPRRMPYPVVEYSNNTQNINAVVNNPEYLNGPDNMATRLWWDCNPDIK